MRGEISGHPSCTTSVQVSGKLAGVNACVAVVHSTAAARGGHQADTNIRQLGATTPQFRLIYRRHVTHLCVTVKPG